jgi:F-box protein 9
VGTAVVIRDLMDPSGLLTKYGFEMVLTLKSKPLGRFVASSSLTLTVSLTREATMRLQCLQPFSWNKLELREYNTVRMDTGEGDPLPLRHERPFWFSRVRSYRSYPVDTADLGS